MPTPKNFLVITHVIHTFYEGKYWAYGPYVREINLWLKYVDNATIVAPVDYLKRPDPIDLSYRSSQSRFVAVKRFDLKSIKSSINALIVLPLIIVTLWEEMRKSDHIHLRCPGNMGLIGSIIQMFFPQKTKTAKYAANWDPESNQPFTYRLQKWILSNQLVTRNMKVLTYGNWDFSNKNLFPFFTASYSKKEIEFIEPRPINPTSKIKLLFVGGLQKEKNPMLSLKVCNSLLDQGLNVQLDIYGQGPEMENLISYCQIHNLKKTIFIHGNVAGGNLKSAYQNAHFLIFVSESEGWPKVVAEAMFWACLPVTSPVSCLPEILGNEERGDLVSDSVEEVVSKILTYLSQPELYHQKANLAKKWSQEYTLEKFETEIQKLLFN